MCCRHLIAFAHQQAFNPTTDFPWVVVNDKAQGAPGPGPQFLATLDPATGIVPLPDPRLDQLATLLSPPKVVPSTLEVVDIAGLVDKRPNVIIAGTGVNGRMKPDAHLSSYLEEQGIEFLVGDNEVAVKWYNELKASGNVAACFHLSC